MTELIFRPAEMADAPHIASLVNSAYRGESSRQGWTTEADFLDGRRTDVAEVQRLIAAQETLLLVCLRDNELVSSVLLERAADGAELGMFAIRPSLQGQGSATAGTGSRALFPVDGPRGDRFAILLLLPNLDPIILRFGARFGRIRGRF